MIKLENVKVLPLHNKNFVISNKTELIDMISGIPIIYNYEYGSKEWYSDSTIIGMVAPHSSISIEDDFITSDIYVMSEYIIGLDYSRLVFKNCECSIDMIDKKSKIVKIKKISVIEFSEPSKSEFYRSR